MSKHRSLRLRLASARYHSGERAWGYLLHMYESEGSTGKRREYWREYLLGWVDGFALPYNQHTDY